MVHEGNSTTSKDHSSMAAMITVRMLPFMLGTMETPLLDKWTMLVFYKYDGFINEHLRIFMNQMTSYTSSDLVYCRSFSISLKGEALAQFSLLPPNSIFCQDLL